MRLRTVAQVQFFNNILQAIYQFGTLFNELVAALWHRWVYRAGDGEYFTTLFGCQPGSYLRTTLQVCFNHQTAKTQAADDAIPFREVLWFRWGAQIKFRNNQAMLYDLVSKVAMFSRVDNVESGADYSNRSTVNSECAAVCCPSMPSANPLTMHKP